MHSLELEEALRAIGELKKTLIAKGEATELFGQRLGSRHLGSVPRSVEAVIPFGG